MIYVFIAIHHALNGKIIFNVPSALYSINRVNLLHGIYKRAYVVFYDKPDLLVLYYLWNRSSVIRDNRSSAGECFSHNKPKGLIQFYGIEKRFCVSEPFGLKVKFLMSMPLYTTPTKLYLFCLSASFFCEWLIATSLCLWKRL